MAYRSSVPSSDDGQSETDDVTLKNRARLLVTCQTHFLLPINFVQIYRTLFWPERINLALRLCPLDTLLMVCANLSNALGLF